MRRVHGGKDLIEKFAKDRSFSNISEFAEFLHEVEPKRSKNAWRSAIQRWMKEGNSPFKDKEEYHAVVNERTKVYYDEAADKYLVVMEAVDGFYVVEGDKHRAMKKAYSEAGGNLTTEEMAREFEMPPAWVSEYVRVNKWTHGMQPFTDKEIEGNTVDDLVDEILAMRKIEIIKKAEGKRWRQVEKDAMKYNYFNETVKKDFLEIAQKWKPASVKRIKTKNEGDFAVVLSPTDLHFGKYGWVDEVGQSYDLEEARHRVLTKTEELLKRLPSKPERFYVGVGSDWFHVDNDVGTTTKGTAQDMAATPAQILMEGCDLARQHIDLLRTVSDVELIFMGGNHDRHTSIMLMMYLDAYYKDCEDVNVVVSPEIRQYVTYGNNLIGFTHGDGKVMNKLNALMAHEERSAWGKTSHKLWFHGHLHHQQMREAGGCLIIQLPSLAGEDRYHSRNGYVMAKAGLSAYIIDKEEGLIGSLFAPVVHE
jgi:hypothetical protein